MLSLTFSVAKEAAKGWERDVLDLRGTKEDRSTQTSAPAAAAVPSVPSRGVAGNHFEWSVTCHRLVTLSIY